MRSEDFYLRDDDVKFLFYDLNLSNFSRLLLNLPTGEQSKRLDEKLKGLSHLDVDYCY
jgi:hypothetical protein